MGKNRNVKQRILFRHFPFRWTWTTLKRRILTQSILVFSSKASSIQPRDDIIVATGHRNNAEASVGKCFVIGSWFSITSIPVGSYCAHSELYSLHMRSGAFAVGARTLEIVWANRSEWCDTVLLWWYRTEIERAEYCLYGYCA